MMEKDEKDESEMLVTRNSSFRLPPKAMPKGKGKGKGTGKGKGVIPRI